MTQTERTKMAIDWRIQKGDGYCIDFPTEQQAIDYLNREKDQGHLDGYEVVKFEYESSFERAERLEKENEALKEYSMWLSSLAMTYNNWRFKLMKCETLEEVRDMCIMNFSVIQGTSNQIQIERIGDTKEKYDQEKMKTAVDLLSA